MPDSAGITFSSQYHINSLSMVPTSTLMLVFSSFAIFEKNLNKFVGDVDTIRKIRQFIIVLISNHRSNINIRRNITEVVFGGTSTVDATAPTYCIFD